MEEDVDNVPMKAKDAGTMMDKDDKVVVAPITGFYPKLKSFWSCSHMNCLSTLHVTHQSIYFLYIHFI